MTSYSLGLITQQSHPHVVNLGEGSSERDVAKSMVLSLGHLSAMHRNHASAMFVVNALRNDGAGSQYHSVRIKAAESSDWEDDASE